MYSDIRIAMSFRIEKINSLLVQEISAVLLREIEFPQGVLVTIIKAKTTDDVKEAKIFISVLPFEKSDQVLDILRNNIYHIQQLLNKKLRMKPVPKIFFKIDASEEEAYKVERALLE
jgi:ribosome-binding factor A